MASEESSVPDPRLMEAQMHGSFFDNLVSTIPARAYLREVSEVDRIKSSRFMQNKKGKAPKQDIKEASKKGKRSAARQTVLEIQAEQAAKEAYSDGDSDDDDETKADNSVKATEANGNALKPRSKARAKRKASSDRDDTHKNADNNDDKDNSKTSNGHLDDLPDDQIFKSATHQELKDRLKAKLDALKVKRKADVEANKVKQRKAVANRRAKIKEERKRKSLVRQGQQSFPETKLDRSKGSTEGPDAKKKKVVFSKFDFGDQRKKAKPTPQQLLLMAEKEKEKLKGLREADPEKAKLLEDKTAWKKALQKASGEKVFDNPNLVKKRIKRIEKQKAKSKEAWQERKDEVAADQKARQDKRQENLQKRIDAKKQKKLKKLRKKGRPGF